MSRMTTGTESLRAIRLRAALPRAAAVLVVALLSAAGLRAAIAPAGTTIVSRRAQAPRVDPGAEVFAETFARAYLTWTDGSQTQREAALRPYLSPSLDEDAGVHPGATQSVSWTAAVDEAADGPQTMMTVVAQTTSGLIYLSVPVARDHRGLLFVADYPAIIGPPASTADASLPQRAEVADPSLQTVVARAVRNYLAGNQQNLLADLTPRALVSLPGNVSRSRRHNQPPGSFRSIVWRSK